MSMKIVERGFSIFCVFCLLVCGVLLYPAFSYAEGNTRFFLQDYNKILFLVDVSYSMEEEDPQKYSTELIQMFIDGVYHPQTEIGVIAYNHEISSDYELTSVANSRDRENLKQYVQTFERKGSTNIGYALKEGINRLAKETVQEHDRPILIVISDGQTDATGTKEIQEIEKNKKFAYQKAKQINCPIYTIGFSQEENQELTELKQIAKETKGKFYLFPENGDILAFFSKVFEEIIGVKVWIHQPENSSSKNVNITLNNPYAYLFERHFFTNKNSNQKSWFFSEANDYATIAEGNAYLSAKLLKSEIPTVKITIPTQNKKSSAIYDIQYPYIYPKAEIVNNLNESNLSIVATLYDSQKESVIESEKYLQDLKAQVELTNIKTKETQTIPMVNTGHQFKSSYKSTNSDSYTMQIRIYGDQLELLSPVQTIQLNNHPPVQNEKEPIGVLYTGKREIQLDHIFTDVDGDPLFYRLSNQNDSQIGLSIENSVLKIQSQELGQYTVELIAMDGRGGETKGEIQIEIQNFWDYYQKIIGIILGSILLLVIVFWILFQKIKGKKNVASPPAPIEKAPVFQQARFEGYFLKTINNEEIPVLYWPVQYLEQKHKVSLGELFEMLDVKIKNTEAYNIYFEAGTHGKVIFYHFTKSIISIGNRNIPAKKKEILQYDDKIYILFEDHVTEIEVRYKRVNRKRFN